ncbi:MAG: patatin [Balneola sp.]|jgi:NTE family protein|nr:patatin [Balneola sp.]MBE80104.1 patatin [Balneola sp.]|tara:strand:- start:519 stop:1676 length:1158 start_codon:yes stop_codon:yes gene_type:complete
MKGKRNKESKMHDNKTLGVALSGGGSRAMAFHLGCFRALDDLGFLDKIDHISSVSGGSLFSALYCYYDESFSSTDERVVKLLRSGLQMKIVLKYLSPVSLIRILSTQLISGTTAIICRILNWHPFFSLNPPLRRWYSRTNVFIKVLEKELFKGLTLKSKTKNDIDVIINACELSTGSAFRFGNRETGNWRFGKVKGNSISLSETVACSAAYPLLLPALDKYYTFQKRDLESDERVFLTDGGVYDNTGVTCFDPDKDSNYSFNSFKPDYIFAFDAGHGIYSKRSSPYYMISRMNQSYQTTFRKRQDGIKKDLHEYLKSGKIDGFIFSYLGQNDNALPYLPANFITNDQVNTYPTDFKAMSEEDIELISGRGEQLTRVLISHYNPTI